MTSHARPRHYQPRHRQPQSRTTVLAPVGLAAAVLAGGAIAFGVSSGGGDGRAPSAASGIVLSLPTPATPPPVQALLTSHSKKKKQPAQHRTHRNAHRRHHLAPDTLLIRDTGPACYVEVTRQDGRVLVERVIRGHERLAYRQHNLEVVLGNAGAVRIAVNGHRAHRAGQSGQVVRLHVG